MLNNNFYRFVNYKTSGQFNNSTDLFIVATNGFYLGDTELSGITNLLSSFSCRVGYMSQPATTETLRPSDKSGFTCVASTPAVSKVGNSIFITINITITRTASSPLTDDINTLFLLCNASSNNIFCFYVENFETVSMEQNQSISRQIIIQMD